MAELIPTSYRLKAAQKHQLEKWMLGGVLAVAVSLASLAYTFMWQHRQTSAQAMLQDQFQAKSQAIAQSEAVLANRQALAGQMQKIQGLMDDKVLLSLLKNISDGFSSKDCLEYINIDARGKSIVGKPKDPASKDAPETTDDHYVVHITGITQNNATLSDLVTRLTKQSSPAMNVVLQSSHRDNMLDGQVMRFEILCEKPGTPSGT